MEAEAKGVHGILRRGFQSEKKEGQSTGKYEYFHPKLSRKDRGIGESGESGFYKVIEGEIQVFSSQFHLNSMTEAKILHLLTVLKMELLKLSREEMFSDNRGCSGSWFCLPIPFSSGSSPTCLAPRVDQWRRLNQS